MFWSNLALLPLSILGLNRRNGDWRLFGDGRMHLALDIHGRSDGCGVVYLTLAKFDDVRCNSDLWRKGCRKLIEGDEPTLYGQLAERSSTPDDEWPYVCVSHRGTPDTCFLINLRIAHPDFKRDAYNTGKYIRHGIYAITNRVLDTLK